MPMFTLVLTPRCTDDVFSCTSEFCAQFMDNHHPHTTFDFAGIGARTRSGAIRRARLLVDAPAQGWVVTSIKEVK